MEKSQKHYWAIYEGKAVVFEGSFSACWAELCSRYCNKTMRQLHTAGVRIGRKS